MPLKGRFTQSFPRWADESHSNIWLNNFINVSKSLKNTQFLCRAQSFFFFFFRRNRKSTKQRLLLWKSFKNFLEKHSTVKPFFFWPNLIFSCGYPALACILSAVVEEQLIVFMSHRPLHAHADITFGSTLSCMNMLWHVLITRQSPLFLRVFCESIGSPAAAYHLCCNESTAAPPDSIPPFPTEHNASDFRSDTRFCPACPVASSPVLFSLPFTDSHNTASLTDVFKCLVFISFVCVLRS